MMLVQQKKANYCSPSRRLLVGLFVMVGYIFFYFFMIRTPLFDYLICNLPEVLFIFGYLLLCFYSRRIRGSLIAPRFPNLFIHIRTYSFCITLEVFQMNPVQYGGKASYFKITQSNFGILTGSSKFWIRFPDFGHDIYIRVILYDNHKNITTDFNI